MVVRPEDVTGLLSEKDLALIKRLEKKIDKAILDKFKSSRVQSIHVPLKQNLDDVVVEKIIEIYEKAGWEIYYSSSSFHPDEGPATFCLKRKTT